MQAWDQGQVCQPVQDGDQSLKWLSIHDQYPYDVVKPTRLKKNLNSTRFVNAMKSNSNWHKFKSDGIVYSYKCDKITKML